MPSLSLVHPERDRLSAYALGLLNDTDSAVVESHLSACEACGTVVDAVADDTFISRLKNPGKSEPANDPQPVAKHETVDVPLPLQDHPRYRVLRLLGAGGMGAVYQAEHLLMERTVALKVISRTLTEKPDWIKRFRQEVKAAARLSHPNIVAAFDAEQAGDTHFLVMEYIEGINLAQLVEKEGPLPVAKACNYVRQAALGLQHAFERKNRSAIHSRPLFLPHFKVVYCLSRLTRSVPFTNSSR